MKKVLLLASVASMIEQFNRNNIQILQDMGCEVHVATNFEFGSTFSADRAKEFKKELEKAGISCYQIDFSRNVMQLGQVYRAYRQVKQLFCERKYDAIHCHSPIGGVCARLAGRKYRKNGTKIIYTAHGFHFYKGAPFANWLLYYPIERFLAHFTDVLITINHEDFERAKKFKAGAVYKVPGVGINYKKFIQLKTTAAAFKQKIKIPLNSFVVISVGELCKRKNHMIIAEALHLLGDNEIYYIICGEGEQKEALQYIAEKYKMKDRIKLVGYQNNLVDWMNISDVFAFPSIREGLGLAAIEGMAAGLPLVTSNSNGIKDYMENGKTGFCYKYNDAKGFAEAISLLKKDPQLREKMGKRNQEVAKQYDISNVQKIMEKIYGSVL